jgi:uncharacterized protein (DUF1501 family)
MNRRHLLRAALAAPIAATAGGVLAAPATDTKLLFVFLRGGYDAANLLVPASSPFYYESRPNIAIARPGSGADAGLALDADWALHPALRDTVFPLWEAGQAAFVPFAGTADASRSHFETQDGIEYGQAVGRGVPYGSGFLNRLAVALGGPASIAFTERLPIVFSGTQPVPNLSLRAALRPAVDARQSAIIGAMYGESALGRSVAAHVRALSGGFQDKWDERAEADALAREIGVERAQAAVEILERLEEEVQPVVAHAAGRYEPGVEAKYGVELAGAIDGRQERRVIVQAKGLTEPEDSGLRRHWRRRGRT